MDYSVELEKLILKNQNLQNQLEDQKLEFELKRIDRQLAFETIEKMYQLQIQHLQKCYNRISEEFEIESSKNFLKSLLEILKNLDSAIDMLQKILSHREEDVLEVYIDFFKKNMKDLRFQLSSLTEDLFNSHHHKKEIHGALKGYCINLTKIFDDTPQFSSKVNLKYSSLQKHLEELESQRKTGMELVNQHSIFRYQNFS